MSFTSTPGCRLAAPSVRPVQRIQQGRAALPRRPCSTLTATTAGATPAPRQPACHAAAYLPLPKPLAASRMRRAPRAAPRLGLSAELCPAPTLSAALGTNGIDAQCACPALHSASELVCIAYAGMAGRDVMAAAHRRCPRLPGDVEDAITAARADPAHAAGPLSCLVDRWSTHLQERAPSGSSAVLYIAGAGLLELAELAAGCADDLTAVGQPQAALRTSLTTLELLSHLRFAGRPDAACFQAAVLQLSRASTAAIQAGAAPSEWQVVAVLRAAAQADSCLRLPTWLGHGFAAAAARLADTKAGFQTEAAAVEYAEHYCALLARRQKQLYGARLMAVLEHPLSHPGLTPDHLNRLLAAERAVPAEVTCQLNTWLCNWQRRVEAKRSALANKAATRRDASAPAAAHGAATAAVLEPAHAVAAGVAA